VPPLVFYKTHFRSAEALILLIACMTESGKVRLGLAHVDEFRMHLTTLESCSAYQNAWFAHGLFTLAFYVHFVYAFHTLCYVGLRPLLSSPRLLLALFNCDGVNNHVVSSCIDHLAIISSTKSDERYHVTIWT